MQSVFHTIQGEGPLQGRAAIFLRLGGCNLRCFWCDTDFESSDWHPDMDAVIAHLQALAGQTGTRLVVLTGGEPFRQNIAPLINGLLALGFSVQIETNGTFWVDLPESDNLTIVCSPKTPRLHPRLFARATAFKYVLGAEDADSEDGLPQKSTQRAGKADRLARPRPGAPVYVSPRDDCDPVANDANIRACAQIVMRHNHILSLQIHKILGLD